MLGGLARQKLIAGATNMPIVLGRDKWVPENAVDLTMAGNCCQKAPAGEGRGSVGKS